MTTLTLPSLDRRLLLLVREEATAEPVRQWPARSLQLCSLLLKKMRESIADMRESLERVLSEGAEARSFVRQHAPLLPVLNEYVGTARDLAEQIAQAADAASEGLSEELRLLAAEGQAVRDLLAEALTRASAAPRPFDPARVRAAEAAHSHGETKPISRR